MLENSRNNTQYSHEVLYSCDVLEGPYFIFYSRKCEYVKRKIVILFVIQGEKRKPSKEARENIVRSFFYINNTYVSSSSKTSYHHISSELPPSSSKLCKDVGNTPFALVVREDNIILELPATLIARTALFD